MAPNPNITTITITAIASLTPKLLPEDIFPSPLNFTHIFCCLFDESSVSFSRLPQLELSFSFYLKELFSSRSSIISIPDI